MKVPASWLSRALHGRKKVFIILLASIAVLALWAGHHHRRWVIYLRLSGVPNMHAFSLDRNGYAIEELPFQIGATYAKDHRVYFVDRQGRVFWSRR